MAAAGEFAVILGNRVLVAGRDLRRVGVADGAALFFIEFAAQLQLQRVHLADELLMHLFDQGGIAGETAGIQIAHLIDQGLQLLPRLRTILHCCPNLVEKIQSLVNLALGIGRVGALLLWRRGPIRKSAISGVEVAKHGAITVAATGCIAVRTAHAVADIA